MKHRKEFEALFLQGREGQLLAESQLDTGADGLYFNPVTRAAYEWFERGANAGQHQGEPVAWCMESDIRTTGYNETFPALRFNPQKFDWLTPLYAHADPGKVERLRAEIVELGTLLQRVIDCDDNREYNLDSCIDDIRAALERKQ